MLKQILFNILGIEEQNKKVSEMKAEMKRKTSKLIKYNTELKKELIQKGITFDIARATGGYKLHGSK